MSLVELGWRRFNFFDKELVTDPQNNEQAFLGLQDLESVCSVAGNGLVLFGEGSGGVCQMNKALTVDFWKAYKVSLASMALVPAHNVLVTVGFVLPRNKPVTYDESSSIFRSVTYVKYVMADPALEDEDGVNTLLKVWRLDRMEKGSPFCSRVSRVSQHLGNRPAKATAVAAHSSLGYAAVGFEDSSVLLFKGDITKERQAHKPTNVRDGASMASDGPITGLAFHMLPDRRLVLFVSTTRAIVSYVCRDKDVEKKNVHDAKGCDRNCWALGDAALDYQFVAARRDMVYFYNPEQCALPEDATNGKCHGLERDKDKILARVFGSYLCLVTKDAGVIESGGDSKMHMVTVYDIPGQYIAYNSPVPEVLDVYFEWNNLFVVCKNGKLFRLREKDIQTKLDVLFRKNLYDVAIGLAKRHYCDETYLMEIFKKHGDYLYTKGDFENAVQQYVQTVGKLEPSYVIRKFLDASRIAQLTNYLEALHGAGLASADHTTILLNCYTKLQATDKIERFVADAGNRLTFDVDTAIKVLRSADYTKEALQLAERHHKDDIYLRILLENTKDYQAAVKRIAKLPFEQAEKYLKKYGKVLLANAPNETTALLKTLCSGFDGQRAAADQFIHIFMDDTEKLREFLEHMAQEIGEESSTTFYNTLLELYLRERATNMKADKADAELDRRILALIQNTASPYQNEKELDQALVLCQMYDFGPGMLFIFEKAKMHQNILQYHMTRKNFTEVVRTCHRFGEKDMWVEALWFVARHDDVPFSVISDLLSQIDEQSILPPLMVLEILSHSQSVTLGVVKDYLMNWLKTENEQIGKDERLIKEHQEEIKKVEEKIDDLQYNPQVFQVSKCSACDTPLEVPTVHFLCKHSFHQHCFESYSENDQECPACLPENKKLRALLSARHDSSVKDTYHQFKSDLKDAKDTMAVVAEYFGKGVYQQTSDTNGGAATAKTKQVDRKPKSNNPFDDDT